MRGNSKTQPERLVQIGQQTQVCWNITRNDRPTIEGGEVLENWDYEYANCAGSSYADIVEGVIRSKYTDSQVEAILANFAARRKVLEHLQYQAFRTLAKQVAASEPITVQKVIEVKMPLSFVLVGGKYEVLADRILKFGSPYEVSVTAGIEMVTFWLKEVNPEHAQVIASDAEVLVTEIDLLNEAV